MNLSSIQTTQRKLRNSGQIPHLVERIKEGDKVAPVKLADLGDETFFVIDGHHRLVAYHLAGRTHIDQDEYELGYSDPRPLRGSVAEPLVVQQLMGR